MPVTAAIGAVSAGMNLFKGMRSESRADESQEFQQQIAAKQLELETEKFDIWKKYFLPTEREKADTEGRLLPDYEQASRTMYGAVTEDRDWFQENVRPVEERALEATGPDYGWVTSKAAADMDAEENRGKGIMERELESRGIDAGDGAWANVMQRRFTGKRAAAMTGARETERNAAFNRQMVATGRGAPNRIGSVARMPSGSANMNLTPNLGSAGANAGSAARGYWDMARGYAGAAGAGAELAISNWPESSSSSSSPNWLNTPAARSVRHYAEGGLVRPEGYEGGGLVRGNGTGTSDDVPAVVVGESGKTMDARLSNGEYVVEAEMVEKIVRGYLQENLAGMSRRMV